VVEVLPHVVFQAVEHVLGTSWIEQATEVGPPPLRLEIREPGLLDGLGQYTLHAEIDSAEEDRFDWDLQPDQGEFCFLAASENARETALYSPPLVRPMGTMVRVRVQSRANPDHSLQIRFYLPRTPFRKPLATTPSFLWPGLHDPDRWFNRKGSLIP